MNSRYFIYILTNKHKNVLYIGVTNNLTRRINEHKVRLDKKSFTSRYNVHFCIYFEEFNDIGSAITREKELKGWNRKKKEELITKANPDWKEIVF